MISEDIFKNIVEGRAAERITKKRKRGQYLSEEEQFLNIALCLLAEDENQLYN